MNTGKFCKTCGYGYFGEDANLDICQARDAPIYEGRVSYHFARLLRAPSPLVRISANLPGRFG
jgi:hypothetical protein